MGTKSKILFKENLGVNFGGEPLELYGSGMETEILGNKIADALAENYMLRLHKNLEYELVFKIEPVDKDKYLYREEVVENDNGNLDMDFDPDSDENRVRGLTKVSTPMDIFACIIKAHIASDFKQFVTTDILSVVIDINVIKYDIDFDGEFDPVISIKHEDNESEGILLLNIHELTFIAKEWLKTKTDSYSISYKDELYTIEVNNVHSTIKTGSVRYKNKIELYAVIKACTFINGLGINKALK